MPVGAMRCSICLHPEASQIDLWLKDSQGRGQPRVKTAERFSVSKLALGRHFRAGHWKSPEQWVQQTAVRVRDITTTSSLAALDPTQPLPNDGISQLEQLLQDLAGRDTSKYTPRDLGQHNDQLRRTAESVARLKPPADKEGPASAKVRALEAIIEVYDRVLDGHPEIARELASAMRGLR